jgi:ribonuclease D
LRDRLKAELELIGRLDWAREEFKLLEQLRWSQPVSDELAFTRIKGAKSLPPRSLAILRELHQWRESTAKSLDRAPFRVLANSALLSVARIAPRDVSRLKGIAGLAPSAIERYGNAMVNAVIKGLGVPRNELPTIKRPTRLEHDREYDRRLERLKDLRNTRAKDIKMDPGMLCPNGTLQAIARAAPKTAKQLARIKELKEWQMSVLEVPTILSTVQGENSG